MKVSRKRITIAGLVTLLVVVGVAVALFQVSKSRTFQVFGRIVSRVETEKKQIALTFDDGPTAEKTDEILSILKETGVRATFYVIGADAEKNGEQVRKLIAAGHELGNHTFNHDRMAFASPSFVASEIEKTDQVLRDAGWDKPITFRPPYSSKLFTLPYYLSRHDRLTVTWDVEPETYVTTAEDITLHTLERTRNGSIILLHVMYKSRSESMKAVKPIIDGLKDRGFDFVTVSELIN